jgi:molybdenum-dependent DNA-binding transcriptional regulator ModE
MTMKWLTMPMWKIRQDPSFSLSLATTHNRERVAERFDSHGALINRVQHNSSSKCDTSGGGGGGGGVAVTREGKEMIEKKRKERKEKK